MLFRSSPHPLSPTGYRSHFIAADELKAQGGAVRFVTAWLAREAMARSFVAAEQKRLQGDLFAAGTATPRRPISASRPARSDPHVEPDPDFLTQQEEADAQKWKRRAAVQRGKLVRPPAPGPR